LKPVIGNFTSNRLTDNRFTTLFEMKKKRYSHSTTSTHMSPAAKSGTSADCHESTMK